MLPFWGIDWAKIRQSERGSARSTSCNFSKKQLEVVPNAEMTEDHLIAAVSLPMWFPPVKIDGDTLHRRGLHHRRERRGGDPPRRRRDLGDLDGQHASDEWRAGFVDAVLPHHRERSPTRNFFAIWRRIEENNAAIAAGEPGEFGRHIALQLLQAEVPVHYLLQLLARPHGRSGEPGRRGRARRGAAQNGIPLLQDGGCVR